MHALVSLTIFHDCNFQGWQIFKVFFTHDICDLSERYMAPKCTSEVKFYHTV